MIAGHEPCGVVVAVGRACAENQARVGMRVMQHHYRGCGVCPHCTTGWMQLCVEGVTEVYGVTGHGAHARYMKCPARTLVPLPDELSFDTGAAISCGTGTAWGALQRLGLLGDHTIAVFGQGPVGLSATLLASRMGARVIALDTRPERLARASGLRRRSADQPASRTMPCAPSRTSPHGLGAHARSMPRPRRWRGRQAVRCVRTWGKACFVGEGGEVTLDVSPDLLRRQVTLIGSWTFSTVGQAECARYIADREVDVERLFTHRWRLDQADEAYQLFDRQTTGKGVILPAA